jgi:hexulose-6-phosphate isomerase
MKRKEFLKSTSLLMGASVASPIVNAKLFTSDVNTLNLKKSLGFGMIKEEGLSLTDKLNLAKDIGFDGVEFNSPVELSLQSIISAKNKAGIKIPSTINKDHWSKPLSDPDPSVRQFTIDSVARSLEETKEMGGDTVLIVPGVVNEKVSYAQAYKNSLESIRKLIPYIEKTGIKIGIENVWNNFLLSPLEARDFIDAIGHPLIGWYFDIGNVPRYGWAKDWIEVLGKRIFKLHMKAFSREKMNKEGLWKGFDVKLLEGDINWPEVMQALKNINYNGQWLRVEMKGGDRNYLKDLSQRMDKIIAL